MIDKNLTSIESLAEKLATLRNHGVASASFGADGQLLRVDFAPSLAAPEESEEDAAQAVKTVVDQGLAYLAGRGAYRREKNAEQSE